MIPLFLGLTIANIVCLAGNLALGYVVAGGENLMTWHILIGALAGIMCCAVHCVVFTYFVATAKWVQHAVMVRKLDPGLMQPTRSFKAQAFPFAAISMLSVIATIMAGSITQNYAINPQWHHLIALGMLTVNIISAIFEYGAIKANGELIDRILALCGDQSPQ